MSNSRAPVEEICAMLNGEDSDDFCDADCDFCSISVIAKFGYKVTDHENHRKLSLAAAATATTEARVYHELCGIVPYHTDSSGKTHKNLLADLCLCGKYQ
jgi:hypothetical protein